MEGKWGVRVPHAQEMEGKEGTGDSGGLDAKSRRYSSRGGLCLSGETVFFADAALITKIAGEQADLKGFLPAGSISDYGQKQRFLDGMDSRLRSNVEPQLRPEATWDKMVALAERYDATMYRTGGYKGSDRSQASSSNTHTPNTENTYRKASTTSTRRNTG